MPEARRRDRVERLALNERADELAREGIAAVRSGALGALSAEGPPNKNPLPAKRGEGRKH